MPSRWRLLPLVILGLSIALAIMSLVIFISSLIAGAADGVSDFSGIEQRRLPLMAMHGAVATGNTICNEIGVSMLKRGGNAVDATIATTLCLGARNLIASGIGGGSTFLMRKSDGTVVHIDAREEAPASAHETMLILNNATVARGGVSVAIPGELKLLDYLYNTYSSRNLTWFELFEPTINFTRDGFEMHEYLYKMTSTRTEMISRDPELSKILLDSNMTAIPVGGIIKMPKLSNTLYRIATEGVKLFYSAGEFAETMVSEINAAGGNFTVGDLVNYQLKFKDPIQGTYRGFKIYGAAPPISGGVCIVQALNMLENVKLEPTRRWSGDLAHITVELLKFAFANRLALGDPDFVNLTSIVPTMLDKEYAKKLFSRVNMNTTFPPDYYFDLADKRAIRFDGGTTHLSIVDSERNAISMTTTINGEFGAAFVGPITGILYNNEMDDFSTPGFPNGYGLAPAPANFIAPKKRPLSSMSPTIVVTPEGRTLMTVGGTGGPRILTGVLQTLIDVLDLGMNVREASETARLHHQLYPNHVWAESNYPQYLQTALRERNHQIVLSSLGIVHSVYIDQNNTLWASSDFRKIAKAQGY